MSGVQRLIAEEIRRLGKGAQRDLAAAVGVGQGVVSRWVSGASTPKPESWPLIEQHFGLEPGQLAAAAAEPPDDGVAGEVKNLATDLRHLAGQVADLTRRVAHLERRLDD